MSATMDLHEAGRVTGDLVCVQCGYLLRGQPIDSRCPECGGTVQLTIDAQHLATWPRPWLKRLQFGLRLLVVAIALGWIASAVLFVSSLSMMAGTLRGLAVFERWRLGRYEWALAPPLFAGFGLAVWGTILLTFSEAARVVAAERPRAPWLARVGVVVGIVAVVVLPFALNVTRGTLRDRMIWVWLALLVSGMVAVWNLCTVLGRLAQRIPDERLAHRCASFRWVALLAVILISFESFNFWPILTWLPIHSAWWWWRSVAVTDTLILAGRAAILIAGVVAIFLLSAYARRLGQIVQQ